MPLPPASSPVEVELGRIRELSKSGRHSEALAAAEALSATAPHNRDALYLVAANQRCLNRTKDALATLQRLEQQHPRFSLLYQERGHCYTTLQDPSRALEAFLQAVKFNPVRVTSWIMLERLYRMAGEPASAARAADQVSILERLPPEVVRAGKLFFDGELSAAKNTLQAYVLSGCSHVEAFRLLARIELQCNEVDGAEQWLEAALKVGPNHRSAVLDYVGVLLDQQKYWLALEVIDQMLKLDTRNPDLRRMYATACVGLGRHDSAIDVYRQLLAESPASFDLYVALGHSLQSMGRQSDAIDSYRKATMVRPSFGDAYWSLANLKTYRFSQEEIEHMRAEESAPS